MTLSTCIQLNILKLLESSQGTFDSFDMHAINYILFCTVYFDPFRHEIKHKKIELNFIFYLKVTPHHPPQLCTTVYSSQNVHRKKYFTHQFKNSHFSKLSALATVMLPQWVHTKKVLLVLFPFMPVQRV